MKSNTNNDLRKYHLKSERGQIKFNEEQRKKKLLLSLNKNYKKDKENFFELEESKRIELFNQIFFFSFDQWVSRLTENKETLFT